jgi:hypothetical protein
MLINGDAVIHYNTYIHMSFVKPSLVHFNKLYFVSMLSTSCINDLNKIARYHRCSNVVESVCMLIFNQSMRRTPYVDKW